MLVARDRLKNLALFHILGTLRHQRICRPCTDLTNRDVIQSSMELGKCSNSWRRTGRKGCLQPGGIAQAPVKQQQRKKWRSSEEMGLCWISILWTEL